MFYRFCLLDFLNFNELAIVANYFAAVLFQNQKPSFGGIQFELFAQVLIVFKNVPF